MTGAGIAPKITEASALTQAEFMIGEFAWHRTHIGHSLSQRTGPTEVRID